MKDSFLSWGTGCIFPDVVCTCACAQSHLTLCNPVNFSPLGSSAHDIFQARILEWVAVPFSRGIFPTQGSNQVSCISGWFFYTAPPWKPIFPGDVGPLMMRRPTFRKATLDKASESCPPSLLASCLHLRWVFGTLCPIYYAFSARAWTYSPNVVQCHRCCPVASLTREGLCHEPSKDFTGVQL